MANPQEHVKWKFQKVNIPEVRREFYEIRKSVDDNIKREDIMKKHATFLEEYPHTFYNLIERCPWATELFEMLTKSIENAQRCGKTTMLDETKAFGDATNKLFLPKHLND